MEGLLIIDKIRLRVPILPGITKRNLDLAVASVESTGKPGQEGNYVIAGITAEPTVCFLTASMS